MPLWAMRSARFFSGALALAFGLPLAAGAGPHRHRRRCVVPQVDLATAVLAPAQLGIEHLVEGSAHQVESQHEEDDGNTRREQVRGRRGDLGGTGVEAVSYTHL